MITCRSVIARGRVPVGATPPVAPRPAGRDNTDDHPNSPAAPEPDMTLLTRAAAAAALALVVIGPGVPAEPVVPKSPLTPDGERATFRLAPGLRIDLVAAEPQVESPVFCTFDESGRLWVVEMRDYPNGPAPGKPPEGRIKILEDRDGDGRFETVTVFADNLLFANG